MSGLNYYVIDTETTGLMANYHEIFEISIIRVSDKVQLSRKIKVKNPKNASLEALQITGKNIADLYYGESPYKVIEDINNFFNQDGGDANARCILAHNAPFDQRHLHAMWTTYSSNFPANYWLCTMKLFKQYQKDKGIVKAAAKLPDACAAFNINKAEGIHNAKSDSRNTYFLWLELQKNTSYLKEIKRIPHLLKGQSDSFNTNEKEELLEELNGA